MKRVILIVGLLIVCIGLAFFFSSFGDSVDRVFNDINTRVPSQPSDRPSSTDPSDYVEIVDWDWEISGSGNYIDVTGTVKNTHDSKSICRVRLTSRLKDSRGNDLNTDWSYADSSTIRPNSSSPFNIFYKYVDDADKVTIGVESASYSLCN